MQVTILGTGAFGLALGNLLHEKSKADIVFWTAFEEEYLEITNNNTYDRVLTGIELASNLDVTMDLSVALNNSDLIIVAVPCNHVREVLTRIEDYLTDNSRVILVSKGFEKNTDLLMTEIYEELNLKGQVSYLAGPTFAKELIINSKAGLTLGSKDEKTKELMLKLFKDTNVEIEVIDDNIGLELYGVIKNVLAILMGSINSKYQGDSTNAYYLTKIYNFAKDLVTKLGGKESTSTCYGALGDILLTCNSKTSRNYSYGVLLYTNKNEADVYKKHYTVEGSIAINSLTKLLKKSNQTSPFIEKLTEYFNGTISLDEVLELF